MPYQIPAIADLEQSTTITEVPGIPEINKENPIAVVFRQATEEEDSMRERFVNVPVTMNYGDLGFVESRTHEPKTLNEIRAYEVYLTLADCDIVEVQEKKLFKFENVNGLRKLRDSFPEFQKKWGRLPKPITMAIHHKCLDANPDWDFRWQVPGEAPEGEE